MWGRTEMQRLSHSITEHLSIITCSNMYVLKIIEMFCLEDQIKTFRYLEYTFSTYVMIKKRIDVVL